MPRDPPRLLCAWRAAWPWAIPAAVYTLLRVPSLYEPRWYTVEAAELPPIPAVSN